MTEVLNPAPPMAVGEAPESYVWRLGRAHGFPDAVEFCRLIGMRYRDVLSGCRQAIATLANLVGLPAGLLGADALVRGDDGYMLRGQALVGHSLRRDRLVACPACLQDDLRTDTPPFGRATWSVAHVRTCERHGLALVEMGRSTKGRAGLDLTPIVAPTPGDLDRLAGGATARPASGLERYVLERLDQKGSSTGWLDAMPLHAAARSCELVGTMAEFGRRQNLNLMSEDDWYRAGHAGHAIASGGVDALHDFLRHLHRSHDDGKAVKNGPQAWFGRLYQTLAFGDYGAGFDPLRDVIHDYLTANTPVGPGDEFFGKPVKVRRLHSLRTAFLETGIHPTRLRKVLTATDHVRADEERSDHEVTFDALATAPLLTRLRTALTFLELGPYMNANRVQARLLVVAGLIAPVVSRPGEDVGWHVFARDDVDRFLARLLERAETGLDGEAGMLDIPTAAKRACCHSTEIVDLVLRGDIRTGRRCGAEGYMAVLVDIAEVRSRVRGKELDGLTVDQVQRCLRINPRTLKMLIADGVLASSVQCHPVHRVPVPVVSQHELDRFRRTYVALFEAATTLGLHHLKLKAALVARGARPAFDPTRIKATIYLRSEVPKAASDLAPEEIALKWPKRRIERRARSPI